MIYAANPKDLMQLASELNAAQREGADVDEPEGARYVQMSDTLARKISREMTLAADTIRQLCDLILTDAVFIGGQE